MQPTAVLPAASCSQRTIDITTQPDTGSQALDQVEQALDQIFGRQASPETITSGTPPLILLADDGAIEEGNQDMVHRDDTEICGGQAARHQEENHEDRGPP